MGHDTSSSCVVLSKLLNISGPQFPLYKMGNCNIYRMGWCGNWREHTHGCGLFPPSPAVQHCPWDQPWGPKCLGSGPSEPPEILPELGRSLHIRSILSSGGISVLSNHWINATWQQNLNESAFLLDGAFWEFPPSLHSPCPVSSATSQVHVLRRVLWFGVHLEQGWRG